MILDPATTTLVESSGSRPAQASTVPASSATLPSACCSWVIVTSLVFRPASASACSRKKYGSVPALAAMFLPLRSLIDLIVEFGPTRIAAQFGCEKTSIDLIGEPFERASSAADPAVEPTSIEPA